MEPPQEIFKTHLNACLSDCHREPALAEVLDSMISFFFSPFLSGTTVNIFRLISSPPTVLLDFMKVLAESVQLYSELNLHCYGKTSSRE